MAGLLEYTKNGQVTEPPLYRFMRGNVQSFLNSIPDPSGLTREEQLNLAANVTPTMGLLGTFIGKGSKLWNSKTNDVAKALEKEGVAPETIWSQTGNVKAPDGKWRQEISDVGVTANEMQKAQVYNLGNVLQHEDLFKAYPNLLNTQVKLKGQQNSDSWYSPLGFSGKLSGNTIPFDAIQIGQYENTKELPSFVRQQLFNNEVEKINNQIKDITEEKIVSGKTRYVIKEGMQDKANELNKQFDILKKQFSTKKDALYNPDVSTTLHEVQHNIQQIENFAKGGTPAQSQKSIDNYKRLLGEAEARLTENRIPLTQEQRLQYYPYAQGQYGLDVPYGELIVQGLLK